MKIDIEGVKSFIPTQKIEELIVSQGNAPESRIREIIAKSLAKNRLDPDETAALLSVTDPELK
ncbi:MAG: [FeFe] hydrogenase H-cluster radical SAM maturase HydG, partial [Candidatus Cloacimonadaceae bacterium]|nr:[FeFe] hydrogenase H-cluster radical SAM maturase HydG [Candidatus Cloacimonadaceae bacterium]